MKKADKKSMTKPKQESLHLVDEFPSYENIKHGDLLSLSLSSKTTSFTHGMHRFPAKYIPQVPRWAIKQFCDHESSILDPFMGSGTSLVEGLGLVHKSYGLDIDPLAKLITSAKTMDFDNENLKKISCSLLTHKGKSKRLEDYPMEGVQNPSHWFNEKNKGYLAFIFDYIENLKVNESEKVFFICVFSSTLRWVSNADDQSQKTYVSGTLKKTPPDAWDVFERFLDKALKSIENLSIHRLSNSSVKILDGNALDIPLEENSIDLIITSPPYMDSVDYMYNFMLEYFWLGPLLGVPSRKRFNELRKGSVGSKNPSNKSDVFPEAIRDMVCLNEIPEYRKYAVVNYFHAMYQHFKEASKVLKDGGRYVLVVGNSQTANGIMPVHDCLTKLASDCGLKIEKAFAYRIRRHYMKFPRKGRGGIILMDWVITLVKTTNVLPFENIPLPIPDIKIGKDDVAH
jgi:DNA modification methylase